MYYVIYVSASAKLLTETELKAILVQNELKNKYNHITGILLYSAGVFMQVLEGAKASVLKTYQHIENDIWHKDLIKLGEGSLKQRLFPNWLMSFNTTQFQNLSGYESFVTPGSIPFPKDVTHPCVDMIKLFIESSSLFYDAYSSVNPENKGQIL